MMREKKSGKASFESVYKKIADFEKRFAGKHADFEVHERRLAMIGIRMDALEIRINQEGDGQTKIGVQLEELEWKISLVHEGYCGHDERLRKLWDKNISLEERMQEAFGVVDVKLETVFERLAAFKKGPEGIASQAS